MVGHWAIALLELCFALLYSTLCSALLGGAVLCCAIVLQSLPHPKLGKDSQMGWMDGWMDGWMEVG
jgi:hypothetical protein